MDFGRIQSRLDSLKGFSDLSVSDCSSQDRIDIDDILSQLQSLGFKANTLKKKLRKAKTNIKPDGAELVDGLKFGLLAAFGEMAELSSAIRNASDSDIDAIELIEREIADTLAYLLKIAGRSGVDFRSAYLKTTIVNHWRFSSEPLSDCHYVALVGMSGTGKTTLTGMLAEKLSNASTFCEDVTGNLHFPPASKQDLYKSQSWFMAQHKMAIKKVDKAVAVFEQSPMAIALGYCQAFADVGQLTQNQFVNHLSSAVRIEEEISKKFSKRTMIFLKCDRQERRKRQISREGPIPPIFESDKLEIALTERFDEIGNGLGGRFETHVLDTTNEQAHESLAKILLAIG